MKDLRLFTTSAACALGAMLVTTALQSTPAEAREKSAHSTKTGHASNTPLKEPLHASNTPRKFDVSTLPHAPGGTQATSSSGGIKATKGTQAPIPSGTATPIPPIAGPTNPGKIIPLPPISGTPIPIPPGTGPIIASNFPGSRPPVIVATPTPIPSGTPTPAPIASGTGSLPNPGNYYPGGSIPPISTVPIPTPVPVPIPTGSTSNPGYGTGTTYTHQYGQHGVYADIGAGGGDYGPCLLFKSNYDRTGNAYWLNRYRICLWQH